MPRSNNDTEDPFVALWAERVAKIAEHEKRGQEFDDANEEQRRMLGTACDEACDRVLAVNQEIADTPARTLFGLLVKLRVFLNIEEIAAEQFFGGEQQPTHERLFRGAIADLEQLVGGAS